MHIKIYFGLKPVFLCDKIDEQLKEILQHPDAVFVDEISAPAVKSLLHEIKKEEFHAGVMLDNDFNALKTAFFKHFTLINFKLYTDAAKIFLLNLIALSLFTEFNPLIIFFMFPSRNCQKGCPLFEYQFFTRTLFIFHF